MGCKPILITITIFITASFCVDLPFERQQIQSYQKCRYDNDCKENAFCYGNDDNKIGHCKCKDGYELNRNLTSYECLAPKKIEESCDKDFQCQLTAGPLARCNEFKICDCKPEIAHNYTDKLCYKTIKLGEPCLSDANCRLSDGRFGYCTFGFCECGGKEKPNLDNSSCVHSVKIGERCVNTDECIVNEPNTVCGEICTCNIEHVISRNRSTCLRAATAFGDVCEEDDQCSKFLTDSICTNKICSCKEGYRGSGNKCIKSTAPKSCDTNDCNSEKNHSSNFKVNSIFFLSFQMILVIFFLSVNKNHHII